ncbi:MAG TPA: acetylxylan esterase [Bryobacteraceae bacterium]|nr:acetylxylan esterase [Bryobacteraceae bacterium]
MTIRLRPICFGAVIAAACATVLGAQSDNPRAQLIKYIDGIAQTHLDARKQAISQIKNSAEADRRKAMVREKILHLIGGLPEHHGPVAVKQFGTVTGDGFKMEKIAYESLPGFWVTANVYSPASGEGPFPAIVVTPGHGPTGKTEDWNWGINFARNGIMVLAYDPLGQGERLQYYNPEQKKSEVGGPTGEHGEANLPAMLTGDDLARYMVNDAMRAVDYLATRKDVNADRIGAFGCSGGGTATAYFAALDPRVKVAASACYITSFQELLASPTGNQDAEQSIPHFIQEGMDFPDWVEAFAPKPYAIISTTNDMFPFAGARQSYEEVKKFYGLYKADERVQWITGPGGHGNLGPITPEILTFFIKYLKGTSEKPTYTLMRLTDRQQVQCTPTGQVATSIGGATVYSLNRERAQSLMAPERALASKGDVKRLQTRLRQDIRTLTGISVEPGAAAPIVDVKSTEQREGYQLQTIALHSDADMVVTGVIAIPGSAGAKPATLILDASPQDMSAAAGSDVDHLVKSGRVVLALQPRPTPAGREGIKSPYLGIYNLLSVRAFMVGKTIVGLRTDDAIRAMNWLCARKDVNRSSIAAYGSGPLGIVLLHAAVLDSRIGSVVIENSLASYRMIVNQPLHRNASEVVIPGVLRKYDTGDLILALYPRQVTVLNPKDAMGDAVADSAFQSDLAYVFQSEKKLGGDHLRLMARNPGDPLPME